MWLSAVQVNDAVPPSVWMVRWSEIVVGGGLVGGRVTGRGAGVRVGGRVFWAPSVERGDVVVASTDGTAASVDAVGRRRGVPAGLDAPGWPEDRAEGGWERGLSDGGSAAALGRDTVDDSWWPTILVAHQAMSIVTSTAAIQPSAMVCHLAPLNTPASALRSVAGAEEALHQGNPKQHQSEGT